MVGVEVADEGGTGLAPVPEAGCEVALDPDGAERGGAEGVVESLTTTGTALAGGGCSLLGLSGGLASADRGGASRSSSLAAERVEAGGLVSPAGLAFNERRFIRGFSVAGLSKLNSAGSAPDSGWAAEL